MWTVYERTVISVLMFTFMYVFSLSLKSPDRVEVPVIKFTITIITMFIQLFAIWFYAPLFPFKIEFLIHYIAYFTPSGRSYGTIVNHPSSVKHVNQLLGFGKDWDTNYHFQLVLWDAKRYLGVCAKSQTSFYTSTFVLCSSIIQFRLACKYGHMGTFYHCLF